MLLHTYVLLTVRLYSKINSKINIVNCEDEKCLERLKILNGIFVNVEVL